MATTTERPYTSDGEVWAVFVGEITAEEFIKPFLYRYVSEQLK